MHLCRYFSLKIKSLEKESTFFNSIFFFPYVLYYNCEDLINFYKQTNGPDNNNCKFIFSPQK